MTTDNPVCICTHFRSDHDDSLNPQCTAPHPGSPPGYPCDCPGFEADPKASE